MSNKPVLCRIRKITEIQALKALIHGNIYVRFDDGSYAKTNLSNTVFAARALSNWINEHSLPRYYLKTSR